MQVELVESNSLGHNDQLNSVLQATFASHSSAGSDNDILIWPSSTCDYRPNPLCSSPVLYANHTLDDSSNTTGSTVTTITTTPGPFVHTVDSARSHQRIHSGYHVRAAAAGSVPRVLLPVVDPNLSPNNRRLLNLPPSNMLEWRSPAWHMVVPGLNGADDSSVNPAAADDFIEPDIYYRNMMYPMSDGDASDTSEPGAGSGTRQSTNNSTQRNERDLLAQQHMNDESFEPPHSIGYTCSPSHASNLQNRLMHSEAASGSNYVTRSHSFVPSGEVNTRPSGLFVSSSTTDQTTRPTAVAAFSTCGHASDSPDTSPFSSPVLSSSPSSSSSSSSSSSCIHRPLGLHHTALELDHGGLLAPSESGPVKHQSHPPVSAKTIAMTASQEDLTRTRPLMVLPTTELALGGSLTCTVVNILKGLRLLNRCGLEDLCASLYGLRNIESKAVAHQMASFERSTAFPDLSSPSSASPYASSVIRSSSFTSAALVSPRRSTIPRDYSQNGDVCIRQAQDSRYSASPQSNCLVNYILACSRLGSSLFCGSHTLGSTVSHLLPARSNSGSSTCGLDSLALAYHSISPTYLPTGDWRRGCASNLVNLLTLNPPTAPKSSRATVSRLVAGRFLMGPHAWRSVWPYSITNARLDEPRNLSDELVDWISAWIRHNVVIVLAQLVPSASASALEGQSETSASAELLWCHRLVCGVSENNEIYLSNPIELVSADTVLRELSRQTTLCLDKSTLTGLWAEHLRYTTPPASSTPSGPVAITADGGTVHEASTNGTDVRLRHDDGGEVEMEDEEDEDEEEERDRDERMSTDQAGVPRMHPHQSCVGDFSLLACQSDPRWNQMNVLGQVVQTLRGLDCVGSASRPVQSTIGSGQANQFQPERSSLSASIVIPCVQSPGFSLFAPKSDWELVHALYTPGPFERSHRL